MSNKQYSALLNHPKWQKRRLEIMSRDDFECWMCGYGMESDLDETRRLEVHHSSYKGKPWEAPDSSLHTLCTKCHELVTERELQFRDINKQGSVFAGFVNGIELIQDEPKELHVLFIDLFDSYSNEEYPAVSGNYSGKQIKLITSKIVIYNTCLVVKGSAYRVGDKAWKLLNRVLPKAL